MDLNVNRNSSKELLYSEHTGTSVVEHVMDQLKKKKSTNTIEEDANKNESPELRRAKNIIHLLEKDAASTLKPICQNPGEIEVIMAVDENSPAPKADAWFMLKFLKQQESKCSDDNNDKLEKNTIKHRILDFSNSSDTSDDELQQNFPPANRFALSGTDSSKFSMDKRAINPYFPEINKSLNLIIDDSSSDDEPQQKFPIIANGFMLNDNDSSNSSCGENEINLVPSTMQSSSNLTNGSSSSSVNGDSSNSSDMKDELCLSVSTLKGNVNCENNGTLQISLPREKDKGIFVIPDESSEDFNEELGKHCATLNNTKEISSGKKCNFVLNDSSSYSFDECEQNGRFSHEHIVEEDSDSSNGICDVSISKKEKLQNLKTKSSKYLDSKMAKSLPKKSPSLKRKICVLKDGTSNNCVLENKKKALCLTGE